VKRYTSEKSRAGEDDGQWTHKRITLVPLNPEFEEWDLKEGEQYRVIGELVRVLE
jgi:SOS-response transcriptional repressor LexA